MTDREKVIELTAPILSEVRRGNIGVFEGAEALLDLRQPCKRCDGHGLIADPKHISREYDDVGIECPDCKGTGLERVLFTKEDIKEAGWIDPTTVIMPGESGLLKDEEKGCPNNACRLENRDTCYNCGYLDFIPRHPEYQALALAKDNGYVKLPEDQRESLDFALRIAKVIDNLRDSHVFFYLQQAYPENADDWEWADFQNLLTRILKQAGGK